MGLTIITSFTKKKRSVEKGGRKEKKCREDKTRWKIKLIYIVHNPKKRSRIDEMLVMRRYKRIEDGDDRPILVVRILEIDQK